MQISCPKNVPNPFYILTSFKYVLCSYWKSDKTVKSKHLFLSVLLTLFSHNAMKLLAAGTKLTVDVDETAAGTNHGAKHSYYKCVKTF